MGFQSSLVVLGGIATLVLVRVADQYLLDATATEAGWPLLIGVTILLVVLLVGRRRMVSVP